MLGFTSLSPTRAESLSRKPTTSVKLPRLDRSAWQRSLANGPTPRIKTLLLSFGNDTVTDIRGWVDASDSISICCCSDLLELFMVGFSIVLLLHVIRRCMCI